MEPQRAKVSNDNKRKLVEQILTSGGVAGVITAFLHPTVLAEALLVTAIVLFIFSSVNVYTTLLTGGDMLSDLNYRGSVAVMLGSLVGLIMGLEFDALLAIEGSQSDLLTTLNFLLVFVQLIFLVFRSVFVRVYKTLTDGIIDSSS